MTRIFVEGRDKEFIEVYLSHLYRDTWKGKVEVISTGGYTSLYATEVNKSKLEDTLRGGGVNLVIFDADFSSNGGSHDVRMSFLQLQLKHIGYTPEIFLFPDNKEDGDFETLLEKIINPSHMGLLSCFKGYEKCISGYNQPLYKTPNRKNMIHSYLYTFIKSEEDEKSFNKKSYLYMNTEYWNLNVIHLDPLKEFLERNLNTII